MEQNTEFKDSNLEAFTHIFNRHRGQFVIMDRSIYRLIALATDEWDYYWVLYDGRKLRWTTCLMTIIPLKDELSEYYYDKLVNSSMMTDLDQIEHWSKDKEEAKIFRETHIKEISFRKNEDSRYMTEMEWEIK